LLIALFTTSASGELEQGKTYQYSGTTHSFKVLGKLGKGDFGIVYRIKDLQTGNISALKFFEHEDTLEIANEGLRNLSAAMKRGKEQIVQTERRSINVDGQPTEVHVMEIMKGKITDLAPALRLTEKGITGEEFARRIAHQIHIGEQVIRAWGVVKKHNNLHRDIKPANILYRLESDGVSYRVKLADPDVAVDRTHIAPGRMDGEGNFLYAAPERMLGGPLKDVGHEADFFSVAHTLYFQLTGKKIFDGVTLRNNPLNSMPRMMMAMAVPHFFDQQIRTRVEATLNEIIEDFEKTELADTALKKERLQALKNYKKIIMDGLIKVPRQRAEAIEKNPFIREIIETSPGPSKTKRWYTNICSWAYALVGAR